MQKESRTVTLQNGMHLFLLHVAHHSVSKKKLMVLDLCCCSHAKTFNVAHYSKCIKVINTRLGILSYQDKMQLQDKVHKSKIYSIGVMPLFNLNF